MKVKKITLALLAILFCSALIFTSHADSTIKVGVPLPLTGPYAHDGLAGRQAVTFAVEEINKKGGVIGRQLEMFFYDVEDVMPEKVIASAQDLCMGKKVNVLVTFWVDYGVDVKSYGRFDMPYFSGAASSLSAEAYKEDPDTYRNFFEYNPTEHEYSRQGWVKMMELPYKYPNNKVFVINEDDNWSHVIADEFIKMAKSDEWEIVGDETVTIENVEWGGILTKIRATNPSMIFMIALSPTAEAAFLKQFQTNPTNSLIFMPYTPIAPEFKELAGEFGNGVLWDQLVVNPPTPEGEAFKNAFIERWGREYWRIDTPAEIWDAMHLWKNAVEAVGSVDDYKAIVEFIENNPYEGLCGKYVYPKETHIAISGDEYVPAGFYQIQNGVDVQLSPDRYKQGEFMIPTWIK